MIYLTDDDLTADSFQRFIEESAGDINTIIDYNEKRAVEFAKSYLSDRYDTATIFGYTIEDDPPVQIPPLRNELLADIITKITLYKIFRRNAARKVPSDSKEDYEWAVKQLERINAGRTSLDLPPAIDKNGQPLSDAIWGDLRNPDFYI